MNSVNGKRCFLSGPMSDDPITYHIHVFVDAHMILNAIGAKNVYNPAVEWVRYHGPDRTHEEWMRECINTLTSSLPDDPDKRLWDCMVSLPGWEDSEGARTERMVASACGIECYDYSEVIDCGLHA